MEIIIEEKTDSQHRTEVLLSKANNDDECCDVETIITYVCLPAKNKKSKNYLQDKHKIGFWKESVKDKNQREFFSASISFTLSSFT